MNSQQHAADLSRLLEEVVSRFGSLAYPADADGRKILATQLVLRGARICEPPAAEPAPPAPTPEAVAFVSLAYAPAHLPAGHGRLFATDLEGRLWSLKISDATEGWMEVERPAA